MTPASLQNLLLSIAAFIYLLSVTGYFLYLFAQKERFQHTAFGLT